MAYAECSFSVQGGRTYDYQIPAGLELQSGDKVRVPAARGEGFQVVYIRGVKEETTVKPEWIKTILGKDEGENNE